MNDTMNPNDEQFLATFIEPARAAADNPELNAAAERLRAKLPAAEAPRSTGWIPRFATLAVLITGLSLTVPFLVPGGGGTAFAQVQAWFSSYSTVDVRTEIMTGSTVIVDVRARATADGNALIEQKGVTQILNASAGTFTTLLPDQRYMQMPIAGVDNPRESMAWLDELATFQGEAVLIETTRVIGDREALGHRLQIDGVDLTLWSDALDNQPLLLEGLLPGDLEMRTTFAFNVDLAPWLFELPPGYSPVVTE
ncbi:MAG: hypothetical protein AAFQ99_08260 [Pseudomonadota bacterium]